MNEYINKRYVTGEIGGLKKEIKTLNNNNHIIKISGTWKNNESTSDENEGLHVKERPTKTHTHTHIHSSLKDS